MLARHRGSYLVSLVVVLLLLSTEGCECGASIGPTSQPSPSGGPSLIANYCFDNSVGSEKFALTVAFSGTLNSVTGTPGAGTSFKTQETGSFTPPTSQECVTTRVSGLKPGEWSITAIPNGIGAQKTCPAKVPGIITLDAKNNTCTTGI